MDPAGLTAVRLDVTDARSISASRAQVDREANGELDALVNNAGIAIGGALETVPPEELRRILDVNVVGQMAVTQALLPLLRRAGGKILFIGSVGGPRREDARLPAAAAARCPLRSPCAAVHGTSLKPALPGEAFWSFAKGKKS